MDRLEAGGALSSLARGSLPLPRGKGAVSSIKKLSSLTKSNLDWIEFFPVSEDEVEDVSLPCEGTREDQTSLVKAGSLKELHPFFLIVGGLPCVEEEEQEEMVRSSHP